MTSLDEILAYGNAPDPATGQPRANALQQAAAVKAWQADTTATGRTTQPDPDKFWSGTLALDADVAAVMETLRTKATDDAARTLFTEDERKNFFQLLEAAGKDFENMDAPERWIANARAVDTIAQADVFKTPRYQSGTIGVGPNVLAHYLVREKEDGSGYQAYVQPMGEAKDDNGIATVKTPVTLDLPPLDTLRQKATERAAQTAREYDLYAPSTQDMAMGEVGGSLGMGNFLEELSTRRDAAAQRAAILNGPDLSAALHIGLDSELVTNDAFLQQLPGGPKAWAEQLTTRPLAQMARGFAQAAAALPGTDNTALTAEGQQAVDLVTPGALRNRYENSPEGTTPIADMIASGIESAGTLLLPGGIAKLGGRAMAATNAGRGLMAAEALAGAQPAVNAGWTASFATASGQSYAATEQEAAALELTDPAKAARLRRWNGLTSLAKGAIEMGSERLFPGEMALLQGGRVSLGQLARMPLQEGAEEAAGALAQNALNATTGQTMEDPIQAFRGGFYGAAPFVAAAAIPGRLTPNPADTAPAPVDPNAPPVETAAPGDPLNDPEASFFPTDAAGVEPPPALSLTDIAARAGTMDPASDVLPGDDGTLDNSLRNSEPPPSETPVPSTPEELEDGSPNLLPDGVTPQEALAFQAAQDDFIARNPDTATVPEPLRTLASQLDLVREGDKPSMIFPGVPRAALPAALRPVSGRDVPIDGVDTPEGFVIFNKAAIRPLLGLNAAAPYTAVQASARTAFRNPQLAGQLLGYGTPDKPADADRALVIRNPDGTEALAVAANEATDPTVRAALNRAGRKIGRTNSDLNFRASPLAEFVRQSGGVMSRAQAKINGLYKANTAYWDDAPTRWAHPSHVSIYGTIEPADMAQMAYERGLIPEATAPALWQTLMEESIAANSSGKQQTAESREMAALEQQAKRESLDFTLTMRARDREDERRQALRQQARQVSSADNLSRENLRMETDETTYQNEVDLNQQIEQRKAQGWELGSRSSKSLNGKTVNHARWSRFSMAQGPTERRASGKVVEDDNVPFARGTRPGQAAPAPRAARVGASTKAGADALELLRRANPAFVANTRVLPNREAIAAERDSYTPSNWADMGPRGVQGFFDPSNGTTTVLLDNVEIRPGETPARAVARILLHERIAHAGLSALLELDPRFATQWDTLTRKIPAAELAAIAQRYPELSGNRPALAEEWLAEQVEARAGKLLTPGSLARQLWDALRSAITRLLQAFGRAPLPAEIDEIIRLASRALKAQQQATSAGSLQFARPSLMPKPDESSEVFYAGQGAYRIKNPTWRELLTGSVLTKETAEIMELARNEKAALDMVAAALALDLKKSIEAHSTKFALNINDTMALVDMAMQNPNILQSISDPMLKEATRKARNFLDDHSESIAIRTGGQLGSSIMANRGHWMRRAYKAFDPAANWNYDSVSKLAKEGVKVDGYDMAKVLGDAENFLLQEDPRRTPAQIEAILRQMMDRNVWTEALTTGSGVSKPVTSLMRRTELPAELRAVMGEETNVLKKFTLSAGFQGAFLAKHEQQVRIAEIGLATGLFSTSKEGVYTEELSTGGASASGQRRSGFAGLYTTPEFKAALARARIVGGQEIGYQFVDILSTLSRLGKFNNVGGNIRSWIPNILGGFIGVVQNGLIYNPRAMRLMAEAWKIRDGSKDMSKALNTAQQALREQKRSMLARLTAAGISDSSFELRDMEATLDLSLQAYLENPSKKWADRFMGAGQGALMGAGLGKVSVPTRIAGAALGAVGGALVGQKRITNAQRKIAEFTLGKSDSYFKVIAFLSNYETHLLAGLPESVAFDMAAEKTTATMPTQAKVPAVLRSASRVGLFFGSFISFISELYRNTYNSIRIGLREVRSSNGYIRRQGMARLAGVASVQIIAKYGIPALIANLFGKGQDDEEDSIFRRWLGADWNRYQNLLYTAFNKEQITYFNTSYLIPQTTLTEVVRAAVEGRSLTDGLTSAVEAANQQFGGNGIAMDPILQAIANRDGFDRKISYRDGIRGFVEKFLYATDKIFTPGIANDIEKAVRAATGAQKEQRKYTFDEIWMGWLGMRAKTDTTPELVENAMHRFNTRYDNAKQLAKRASGLNEPFGGREKAVTEANQMVAKIQKDYQDFMKDMEKIGFDKVVQQVNTTRRDKNGRKMGALLDPKTFRPFVLTPAGIETVK